jgi:transcriptional regulator with XRE-family HTH domain
VTDIDADNEAGGHVDAHYSREVGVRLRAIRKQQKLSLQAVEQRSNGRFKAVVVGSYERGDRVVSVNRLAQLAAFYGVPITELLPARGAQSGFAGGPGRDDHIVLNLRRLRELPAEASEPADRYVRSIQQERGDYGNDVLSLRAEDIRPLAIMYGTTPEQLLAGWREAGVLGR